MKVIVIGSVGTTKLTIEMLHKYNFEIVGVLGYEPLNQNRVSGFQDLRNVCANLNLEYRGFQKINDENHLNWARNKKPDLIFAVGFSQLLFSDWLKLPVKGCIGFHPTLLPRGRGRAPVAWTILEGENGAASFFLMGDSADSGPIFVQEKFELDENDDTESFAVKLREAIIKALDNWLPKLRVGMWNPKPQNEVLATYYGKREPCDSLIDWSKHASIIDRLIKASTSPHPGAFSFFNLHLIKVWKSRVNIDNIYKGTIGRILLIENNSLLIQCGQDSTLWVDKYETENSIRLKIGDKLGNYEQNKMDEYINNLVWKKK